MSCGVRRALMLVLAGTLAVSVPACALPTDDEARRVNDASVDELVAPSTTTTTTEPGPTRERRLYFFQNEVLTDEVQQVPLDASVADILNRLPAGPNHANWRNEVPSGVEIAGAELGDDGTLTIQLADEELLQVTGSQITRAVAQIVVTATQLQGFEVDQVRFEIDGDVLNIPAGPEGADTNEPVDECDYQQFYPDAACPLAAS